MICFDYSIIPISLYGIFQYIAGVSSTKFGTISLWWSTITMLKKEYKSTEKNVETARRKDINKTVLKTKIKHKYNTKT